jgi:CubicO group peptidase (beta-lactamase class C family)
MFKKSLFVAALVFINLLGASAQTTPLEKSTYRVALKVIDLLNRKMTDSLYAIASTSMRETISPSIWTSLLTNNVYPLLPFKDLTFESSTDSISKYQLKGSVPLMLYFSIDKTGKFNNLNFQPVERKMIAAEMPAEAKRTDLVAQKMIRLINEKQIDSTYALMGESFKKQLSAETWKNTMEKSIFPLIPFNEFIYLDTKNKINRYKSGQFQFLVSLDQQNKIAVFIVQAYKEEVPDKKFNSDNPLKSKLDSNANAPLAAYMRNKGNVGLSIGIFYGGKDYYYNYGETKLGNAKLPTNHTLYDIGSITKTFTSTLLALAVNEGKVKLTSPITAFLPDSVASNPALKGITLMQLANHTSGLPRLSTNMDRTVTDISQPYENYDTKHLFSFLKSFKSIRPPGTKYDYSNLAVGLLGVILEKIYKAPYQELVAKYIAKPAELNQLLFAIKGSDTTLLAQGYNESILPIAPWKFQAMQAAGAIKSSTTDLLSYGKLQLGNNATPLSKAINLTHQLTFKDEQNSIGLGWHFYNGDTKIIQHSGGTGGYRSLVCVDLALNIVVVVLTNNTSSGDAVGFEVIKAIHQLK